MHHDLIVISQNYHVIHHKQYYDIIGWIRRWNTSTALNITTVALGGAQLNFPSRIFLFTWAFPGKIGI